jgi:hypothetical protein
MSEFFQTNIGLLLAKKTFGQILLKEFKGINPEGGDKGLRFEIFDLSKEISIGHVDENISITGEKIVLNTSIDFQLELSVEKDGKFKPHEILLNVQDVRRNSSFNSKVL